MGDHQLAIYFVMSINRSYMLHRATAHLTECLPINANVTTEAHVYSGTNSTGHAKSLVKIYNEDFLSLFPYLCKYKTERFCEVKNNSSDKW
jgi:hypothetical protein